MTTRTIYVLVGVFLMLAIAATAPKWMPSNDDADGGGGSSLTLSEFSPGDTTKVVIARTGQKPVTLSKHGSDWKLGNKTVPATQIGAFFKVLDGLDEGTLVSRNPDNHEGFGTTAKLGTTLTLTSDGTETVFIVGNGGDTPESFYIKQKDSDSVYQMTGALLAELAQDANAWATKEPDPNAAATAGAPPVSGMPPAAVGGAPGASGGTG